MPSSSWESSCSTRVLGFVQDYRAEKALAALKKLAVPIVRVRREGAVREISARELVPGDIVLMEVGNYVPADCRLVESVNLKIQEAALTGESEAVAKQVEPLEGEDLPLGDRTNTAYMGTVVTYGHGQAVVTETGMNTELGKIARSMQTVETEPTPLQTRLAQLGRTLALVALGIVASGVCDGHAPWRRSAVDVDDSPEPGRRRCAGRFTGRRDRRAGRWCAANVQTSRTDSQTSRRRNARLGDGDLFGQDRHADGKPHDRHHARRGG